MKKHRVIILILIFAFFSVQIYSQTTNSETGEQEELETILKKSAEYCEKLSNSVLDFICIEKITEEINTYISKREGFRKVLDRNDGGGIVVAPHPKKETNIYIYDYQMIRKDNKIRDRRILIRENGKKKNEVDVQLKTKRFKYQNIIFGPIALLAELMQPQYNYKIIKKGKFKGNKVVVIEATPKDTNKTNNPYGKLWIKEDDFSIVKIEWDQDSLPNLDFLIEDAKKFKSDPVIQIYAEYTFEKNGIRFPSKYNIVESYYRKGVKYFTRARLYVNYRNYKFFTVKSDWKY